MNGNFLKSKEKIYLSNILRNSQTRFRSMNADVFEKSLFLQRYSKFEVNKTIQVMSLFLLRCSVTIVF